MSPHESTSRIFWQMASLRNWGMNPPHVGCLPRGAENHHPTIVVTYLKHGPGAAAKKEAGHALDEADDELLIERTKRLPSASLHGVALWAREDGEGLHEVPPAESTLRPRSKDEHAARQRERLVLDQPIDQAVEFITANSAEIGDSERCSQAGCSATPLLANDIASS